MIKCPIPLTEDLIPAGRKNRPGGTMTAKYITIHDTGNPKPGAGSRNHALYLKDEVAAAAPVSWHFTVDFTGAYQHLPLNEHGWHAGDGHGPGNMESVGIEICENADGNRAEAETNAAALVAWLLICLKLDVSVVVPHKHWGAKNCPHILLNYWDKWIERVCSYKTGYESDSSYLANEIFLMVRDGLADPGHKMTECVTWGELSNVINLLRHVRPE